MIINQQLKNGDYFMKEGFQKDLERNIILGKDSVYIKIYVKPRARWTGLCLKEGDLIFYTEAHPKHHKANESLIKYFSKVLKTRKISIKRGAYSCYKVIEIKELPVNTIIERLGEVIKISC